jgi:hypothetical protein
VEFKERGMKIVELNCCGERLLVNPEQVGGLLPDPSSNGIRTLLHLHGKILKVRGSIEAVAKQLGWIVDPLCTANCTAQPLGSPTGPPSSNQATPNKAGSFRDI